MLIETSLRDEDRGWIHRLSFGFYRILLRYGFMEEVDVPAAVAYQIACRLSQIMDTSFSWRCILCSPRPGRDAVWREKLFAWRPHAESARNSQASDIACRVGTS